MHHALHESRIDMGLGFDPSDRPCIERKRLARARFFVLAHSASEFGDKTALTFDDLKGRPFIGLNSRSPLGQALAKYLDASDLAPNVVAWTETYHIAKALVAKGAGITITDEITARSSIGGEVGMWPLEPAISFDVALLQLSDSPLSLATKRFKQHLGKMVRDLLQS